MCHRQPRRRAIFANKGYQNGGFGAILRTKRKKRSRFTDISAVIHTFDTAKQRTQTDLRQETVLQLGSESANHSIRASSVSVLIDSENWGYSKLEIHSKTESVCIRIPKNKRRTKKRYPPELNLSANFVSIV